MMATWAAAVPHQVLHRHFPAVRETPIFEGLLHSPKPMAERVGVEPTILDRLASNKQHCSSTLSGLLPSESDLQMRHKPAGPAYTRAHAAS